MKGKKKIRFGKRQWILMVTAMMVLSLAAGATAFFITVEKQKKDQQNAAMRRQDVQNAQMQKSSTVTAEGSISVGTVSQTFEMDLSEFTGESAESFSVGQGMAFPQMNMGGTMGTAGSTGSSESRSLTVEEIYIKVGEEVNEGTPVLKVTGDTLTQIRTSLKADAADAKTVYEQMATQQKQAQKEAELALKENQLYGTYADTEYHLAVEELQEAVTELTETQQEALEELTGLQEKLPELQESLAGQQEVLENAAYIVEYEDRLTNTYSWLSGVNSKEDAETLILNLEQEIESVETEIADKEEELLRLETQLTEAKKALEIGTIEAEGTKAKRLLQEESAQEIYEVTTQLADFEAAAAKEEYETAQEKLEQLDAYLAEGILCADGNGVVTEIPVSVGDSLSEGTKLLARNSYDDVTVTVELDEDDMDAAALNSRVELLAAAFPEEVLEGKVTEIGDAQIDSDTNQTTYEVTVTILENGAKLYEGMSAELTFFRKEEASQ